MPSLKLLEAFYWVARLKGFHAAADRLRVTQPSISYRVKELEGQLGRPLLARTGRSFRLTTHGQAVFLHAERMITAAQDLQQHFQLGGALTGPIRLGVTDAFAALCLPYLLRRMEADHPALDISVVVDNSHLLTDVLDNGQLDVVVVSTPPILPGLRYDLLGYQLVDWIGGPADPQSPLEDATWIATARVFITPPPSNLHVITTDWFAAFGLAAPRLSVCNSMSAIVGLIQAGAGIGILPLPLVAGRLQGGVMRRLELPGAIQWQGIFAAYNKGVLDRVIHDMIVAIRTVVREQAFCDQGAGSGSRAT